MKLNRPTDFKVGPDGAFYAINYAGNYNTVDATAIVRLDYNGTCRPAIASTTSNPAGQTISPGALRIEGLRVLVNLNIASELQVWDLSGKVRLTKKIAGTAEFDLDRLLRNRPGIYGLTLTSGKARLVKKILVSPQ